MCTYTRVLVRGWIQVSGDQKRMLSTSPDILHQFFSGEAWAFSVELETSNPLWSSCLRTRVTGIYRDAWFITWGWNSNPHNREAAVPSVQPYTFLTTWKEKKPRHLHIWKVIDLMWKWILYEGTEMHASLFNSFGNKGLLCNLGWLWTPVDPLASPPKC